LNRKQLEEYANQEKKKITDFFKDYKGEIPSIGCEKVVDSKKFLETNLSRLQQHHTSQDFIAVMRRLKRIKKHIENV
jgi:hypothetical protein